MDAKEARNELNEIRILINKWQNDTYPSCIARDFMSVDANVIDEAISALEKVPVLEAENARLREKETPKKPTKDGRCYKCNCGYVCPLYSGKAFANREKFCGRCGQKLNWSSDGE